MKLGSGKRAAEKAQKKQARLDGLAQNCQANAEVNLAGYRRTKNPAQLAGYRIESAAAEAYRRGITPHEDGMPADLKRKWRVDESNAIIRAALDARHGARNGGS